MTTAPNAALLARSPEHTSQIEGANFLNLLIVDDDRTIREACRDVAHSLGFNPQVAESVEHAYRILNSSNGNGSTDAVLLGMRPGAAGLDSLHAIKKHRPDAVVIAVTG
jgi:DNA-binding NtrC family response regulator